VIDQILADRGHTVLRLPPYHTSFNSIELISSDVKHLVASDNTNIKSQMSSSCVARDWVDNGNWRMYDSM
jgi:hypothetical protein